MCAGKSNGTLKYPTPLWYSVTDVRQSCDLYNYIYACGISQFTHNVHLLTALAICAGVMWRG